MGTFSLIPTPTKYPMAIFCQETTKKICGAIRQIARSCKRVGASKTLSLRSSDDVDDALGTSWKTLLSGDENVELEVLGIVYN